MALDPKRPDSTPPGEIMQVDIDGTLTPVPLGGVSNFGELLERIEQEVIMPGRVVVSIALNEEELSMDQERLLYGFGLREIASLRLATAEPRSLAIEGLLHAADYLPQLSAGLESSAKLIRSGSMEAGLSRLDASLDLLEHFLQMLDGVRTVLRLDFGRIALRPDEGGNAAVLAQKLTSQVQTLLEAAQDEDWHSASEIAAYDLSPLIYQFIAAMPLILEAALREVPEYRAQLASRAASVRESLVEEIFGGAGGVDEEDLVDDEDEEEDDEAIYSIRQGATNGHSEPDDLTEEMLDDLEEEWDQGDPDLPDSSYGPKDRN